MENDGVYDTVKAANTYVVAHDSRTVQCEDAAVTLLHWLFAPGHSTKSHLVTCLLTVDDYAQADQYCGFSAPQAVHL